MEGIDKAKALKDKPSVIILNTKKGKGCTFAEDVFNHNMPVTQEKADESIAALENYKASL